MMSDAHFEESISPWTAYDVIQAGKGLIVDADSL